MILLFNINNNVAFNQILGIFDFTYGRAGVAQW
jgi:hypothetical protein